MRMWTSSRIALSNVRMVPVITTLSGMMFPRTPPLIVATVTTAGASVMSVWRAVMVCSARDDLAPRSTTGSTPFHGCAPCVCFPFTTIVRPSAIDISAPGLKLSLPGSSGHTCRPKIADGAGFSSAPCSIITARTAALARRRPFLGGLEDELHRARQLRAHAREHGRGAHEHRRVRVVAARVHHADVLACEGRAHRGLERQVHLLGDRAARPCPRAARPRRRASRRAARPTTPVFATPSRTSSPSERR